MAFGEHTSNRDSRGARGVPITEGQSAAGRAASTEPRAAGADFARLRQIVRQQGLYDPQPRYLALKLIMVVLMLAVSIAVLFLVDSVWVQLLNATFLAITLTQIGLVGHDVGHRQTLRRGWLNDLLGLVLGNLLLGISRDWWVNKHNMHHSHPNEADVDPDLDVPFIAWSEEQALAKRGLPRFIVTYQAFMLLPMMTLQSVALHYEAIRHVLTGHPKHRLAEAVLLIAHYVLFLGVVVLALGPWGGLLFLVVNQMLFGLYMSTIFAPNHKGMPLWDAAAPPDFLRQQVVTSRNVRPGPVVDWWYGGLNYQIEHHLFPTMPRNRLSDAQAIVRDYCAGLGITYHETGVLQSYREIFQNLHEIGAVLRAKQTT
ncbi:MAG: fatty acid desaturase [Chloroflexi bacterium]|nr:fatty acid desaturase [Chloroflexota bacterium]